MENLKHTPGPWAIHEREDENGDPSIFIHHPAMRMDGTKRIGDVVCWLEMGYVDDIQEANARLIARSPELADLLRRVAAIAPATSGADALALCDELEALQAEARILLAACS